MLEQLAGFCSTLSSSGAVEAWRPKGEWGLLGSLVRSIFIFWPGVLAIISLAEGVRETELLMSEASLSLLLS